MTLRFEPDVSHADWWATRDEPWEVLATVGPSGFPAYAQVLAPMAEEDPRIPLLEAREGWNWDDQVLAAVLDVLGAHTSTPDDGCWCLWDGYRDHRPGPRVRIPHREYLLWRGPVTGIPDWGPEATSSVAPPAAGWPADRAWFLAFDVDPCWLSVGGSRAAVDALVADPRVRALPAAWGPLTDPRGEPT